MPCFVITALDPLLKLWRWSCLSDTINRTIISQHNKTSSKSIKLALCRFWFWTIFFLVDNVIAISYKEASLIVKMYDIFSKYTSIGLKRHESAHDLRWFDAFSMLDGGILCVNDTISLHHSTLTSHKNSFRISLICYFVVVASDGALDVVYFLFCLNSFIDCDSVYLIHFDKNSQTEWERERESSRRRSKNDTKTQKKERKKKKRKKNPKRKAHLLCELAILFLNSLFYRTGSLNK